MKISGIGFIYMITSPTGRIYIGSTIDLDQRIKSYICLQCKSQIKLYNSFKKYGFENHMFEVIWAGDIQEMYKYETLIGWGFNVLEPENLNCRLPKLGDLYKVVSIDTRKKMSISGIGKKHSEETRLKMKNRIISNTTKLKMSNSAKGKIFSKETRLKLSQKGKGRILSRELRTQISVRQLGKKLSKEHIENMIKGKQKPILQYDLQGNFIKEWISSKLACETLSIGRKNIGECLNGRSKTAGNFKWKYKNENIFNNKQKTNV